MIRINKGTASAATAVNNSNSENVMPNLKIVNGNTIISNPPPVIIQNSGVAMLQPHIKIKRSSVKFNERQVSYS